MRIRLACAAGLLLPTTALALGIGPMQTKSSLNEPFEAKIPWVDAKVEELDPRKVGLANRAPFKRAGLEFPLALSDLNFRFELVPGSDYGRIWSKEPVREPVLDFLLEGNWKNGRLIREFTALLDPPRYGSTSNAARHRLADTTATSPRSPATKSAALRDATPGYASNQYGRTQAGDTLWEIARGIRGDVSVQQMMIALLQANPDAFIDDNINWLKQGQILRIPDATALSSVTPAGALAEVRRHNVLWEHYRQRLAASVSKRSIGADTQDEDSHLSARLKEAEDLVELLRRQVQLKDDELAALQAKLAPEAAEKPSGDPFQEQPEVSQQATGADAGEETASPTVVPPQPEAWATDTPVPTEPTAAESLGEPVAASAAPAATAAPTWEAPVPAPAVADGQEMASSQVQAPPVSAEQGGQGVDVAPPSSETEPLAAHPQKSAPVVDSAPPEGAPLMPGGIYSGIGLIALAGMVAFWVFWRIRAKNQGKDEEELTVEVTCDDKYRQPSARIFATQEVSGRDSTAVQDDFVVVEDLTAAEDVVVRNLTDEIGEKTQELDAGDIRENDRFEMWLARRQDRALRVDI